MPQLILQLTKWATLPIFACASIATAHAKPTSLRVLTLNVHGLPWPLTKDHGEWKKIGEIFADLRAKGTQPQVVVLQEGFRNKNIKELIELSGYKYVARGPDGSEDSPFDTDSSYDALSTVINSGSYILSDYPILQTDHVPYGRNACAGWDCLANKAVLFGAIQIPGYEQPLNIFTTHMNSSKSSGVSKKKYVASRVRQVEILNIFIDQMLKEREGKAAIVLGDFNQFPDNEPYALLASTLGMKNAQEQCLLKADGCVVLSKESEADIFYHTPDHQFYQSGSEMILTPKVMNHTFYETINGRPVSDHLGLEIVYQLGN